MSDTPRLPKQIWRIRVKRNGQWQTDNLFNEDAARERAMHLATTTWNPAEAVELWVSELAWESEGRWGR